MNCNPGWRNYTSRISSNERCMRHLYTFYTRLRHKDCSNLDSSKEEKNLSSVNFMEHKNNVLAAIIISYLQIRLLNNVDTISLWTTRETKHESNCRHWLKKKRKLARWISRSEDDNHVCWKDIQWHMASILRQVKRSWQANLTLEESGRTVEFSSFPSWAIHEWGSWTVKHKLCTVQLVD